MSRALRQALIGALRARAQGSHGAGASGLLRNEGSLRGFALLLSGRLLSQRFLDLADLLAFDDGLSGHSLGLRLSARGGGAGEGFLHAELVL